MNAARQSDGLLGAAHTLSFLEMMMGFPGQVSSDQLIHDFAATTHISLAKTYNTLLMIYNLGLVEIQNGTIQFETKFSFIKDTWYQKLQQSVYGEIIRRIVSTNRKNCIVRTNKKSILVLDSFLLPGTDDGLKLWVLEFSIASKEMLQTRFWTISDIFIEHFLSCAGKMNEDLTLPKRTKRQLDNDMDRKSELGFEAENWVLKYERRRLIEHDFVGLIRQVSETHVSAGFDIVSFSNISSLFHDRFIEVKSYSEIHRFFWTRNEIAVAKELGQQYALYLVDRNHFSDQSYTPKIIIDPYHALITTKNTGWEYEPNSYEFQKLSV